MVQIGPILINRRCFPGVLVRCCGSAAHVLHALPLRDMGMRGFARAKMHVRCLHETDFTLAPGIAPEHPFFPQLEQCFKTNPLDSTAFVSMKGASGHPCTCRSGQDNYDYDCSCLLLPAFPRESCLLSSIRCCGGTFCADHNRTRSLVSIKDGTPAFPFISAIILLTTPTQP